MQGWSPPGAVANPGRYRLDLKKGWAAPGDHLGPGGTQFVMPSDFDPRLRNAGWNVLASPPGSQAPVDRLNYTPQGREVTPPGQLAPVDKFNLSLLPETNPTPPEIISPAGGSDFEGMTLEEATQRLIEALGFGMGMGGAVGAGGDVGSGQGPREFPLSPEEAYQIIISQQAPSAWDPNTQMEIPGWKEAIRQQPAEQATSQARDILRGATPEQRRQYTQNQQLIDAFELSSPEYQAKYPPGAAVGPTPATSMTPPGEAAPVGPAAQTRPTGEADTSGGANIGMMPAEPAAPPPAETPPTGEPPRRLGETWTVEEGQSAQGFPITARYVQEENGPVRYDSMEPYPFWDNGRRAGYHNPKTGGTTWASRAAAAVAPGSYLVDAEGNITGQAPPAPRAPNIDAVQTAEGTLIYRNGEPFRTVPAKSTVLGSNAIEILTEGPDGKLTRIKMPFTFQFEGGLYEHNPDTGETTPIAESPWRQFKEGPDGTLLTIDEKTGEPRIAFRVPKVTAQVFEVGDDLILASGEGENVTARTIHTKKPERKYAAIGRSWVEYDPASGETKKIYQEPEEATFANDVYTIPAGQHVQIHEGPGGGMREYNRPGGPAYERRPEPVGGGQSQGSPRWDAPPPDPLDWLRRILRPAYDVLVPPRPFDPERYLRARTVDESTGWMPAWNDRQTLTEPDRTYGPHLLPMTRVGGGQGQGPGGGWQPPVDPAAVVGTGNRFGDQASVEGFHKGTDLQAYEGTPALAPVTGTVVGIEDDPQGLGIQVLIKAATGEIHRLSHLKSVAVQEMDRVQAGQPVGEVGSTGNSTGPHLDYRIQNQMGQYENPEQLTGPLSQMPDASGQSAPQSVGRKPRGWVPTGAGQGEGQDEPPQKPPQKPSTPSPQAPKPPPSGPYDGWIKNVGEGQGNAAGWFPIADLWGDYSIGDAVDYARRGAGSLKDRLGDIWRSRIPNIPRDLTPEELRQRLGQETVNRVNSLVSRAGPGIIPGWDAAMVRWWRENFIDPRTMYDVGVGQDENIYGPPGDEQAQSFWGDFWGDYKPPASPTPGGRVTTIRDPSGNEIAQLPPYTPPTGPVGAYHPGLFGVAPSGSIAPWGNQNPWAAPYTGPSPTNAPPAGGTNGTNGPNGPKQFDEDLARERNRIEREKIAAAKYGADKQYAASMADIESRYRIHQDDDRFRREALAAEVQWRRERNALDERMAQLDRQLNIAQSALKNPWLQNLSGMAPGWGEPGSPQSIGQLMIKNTSGIDVGHMPQGATAPPFVGAGQGGWVPDPSSSWGPGGDPRQAKIAANMTTSQDIPAGAGDWVEAPEYEAISPGDWTGGFWAGGYQPDLSSGNAGSIRRSIAPETLQQQFGPNVRFEGGKVFLRGGGPATNVGAASQAASSAVGQAMGGTPTTNGQPQPVNEPLMGWEPYQAMDPFERAALRTRLELTGPGNWEKYVNNLRNKWGTEGGPTSFGTTSLLSQLNMKPRQRLGQQQLTETFGETPGEYEYRQRAGWAPAQASSVSIKA